MKTSAYLAVAIILSACGVVRPVLDQDNTKVEVHTVEVPVHDTTYLVIPKEVEKVVSLDTTSVLENSVAISSVMVVAGLLHHSLETKDISLPVPIESKIVYRDSIVFRDRNKYITKEVEKSLTGWQKAKLRVGGICFFIIIIYGIYIILHFIINHKTFKL